MDTTATEEFVEGVPLTVQAAPKPKTAGTSKKRKERDADGEEGVKKPKRFQALTEGLFKEFKTFYEDRDMNVDEFYLSAIRVFNEHVNTRAEPPNVPIRDVYTYMVAAIVETQSLVDRVGKIDEEKLKLLYEATYQKVKPFLSSEKTENPYEVMFEKMQKDRQERRKLVH